MLINKVKEDEHLRAIRGLREDIGILYLHGPMDYAKRLKLLFRVGDLDLPERRKRNTSSREEEDVDAHICPCGTTIECRTNIVGTCEIYKEERDALEMRNSDECDMDEYGRLESSEKTIAILGNRGWLQTAKQEGDRISKQLLRITWKKRNERPNVGGPYIRSKNGAPSRKGYVVNGQTTKASNMSTPPPPPPPSAHGASRLCKQRLPGR